jgi:hypothetical protein
MGIVSFDSECLSGIKGKVEGENALKPLKGKIVIGILPGA